MTTTEWITAGTEIATAVVAVVALAFAWRQVRIAREQRLSLLEEQKQTKNSTLGQFLLQLDAAFARYNEVHRKLRPGGAWATDPRVHPAKDELFEAEAYMGLFERVWVMINRDLLDIEIVDRLYGYRIANIVANDRLVETKLSASPHGWSDFIALVGAIEYYRGNFSAAPWRRFREQHPGTEVTRIETGPKK